MGVGNIASTALVIWCSSVGVRTYSMAEWYSQSQYMGNTDNTIVITNRVTILVACMKSDAPYSLHIFIDLVKATLFRRCA